MKKPKCKVCQKPKNHVEGYESYVWIADHKSSPEGILIHHKCFEKVMKILK